MGSNLLPGYIQLLKQLNSYSNVPEYLKLSLQNYSFIVYRSDQQNKFSEPMPWIGMYIALASMFCILTMVADLVHGFRNKKLWFPCKYFTLNAAYLSVIAVAMKLPMDLNNSMPRNVDQMAKIGSMAFMCTMMANSLPSLAIMDSKELVTNIIALGVLVITLVVNVCIQIITGVVSYPEDEHFIEAVFDFNHLSSDVLISRNKSIAIIYVAMLLMLLTIHTCSALMILTSKKVLQSKYQEGHATVLKDQQPGILSVEKLKKHVSYYWIMAGTGSPQFMTACSATTSASGVICATSCVIHANIFMLTIGYIKDYDSDYKWSIVVIFIIQFVGVVLGTIAPFSRCFTGLSFKLSIKWIWNHINVFKVETYWTRMLSDLKWSGIPFPCSSRIYKIVVQNTKILILNLCIRFQKTIVVACKTIGLIPIIIVICVLCCSHIWKWLTDMFIASNIVLVNKSEQQHSHKDLCHCVLQLQDDMELAERSLKGISNSVNRFIGKSEKQQPKNLMKLLEGFRGFEIFDSHRVPHLLFEEPLNCWSLPVVTLTSIALSLPNIQSNIVDSLLKSVSEGLLYVTLVEESLNTNEDYVNIQKEAKTLWLEVEVYNKWLGYKLHKIAPQVNTSEQILEWFRDTAKNMLTEVESMDNGGPNDESIYRSISANSMYGITQTILLSFHEKILFVSEEHFFAQLSSMIAEILADCLTHLPQVISMRCYAKVIEESEINVHAAAQLLGETMQIINSLQDRELSSLNPKESLQDCELSNLNPNESFQDHKLSSLNPNVMAFIEKGRAYLKHPFP